VKGGTGVFKKGLGQKKWNRRRKGGVTTGDASAIEKRTEKKGKKNLIRAEGE